MGALKDNHIVQRNGSQMVRVFEGLFPGSTFLDIAYDTPQEYVQRCWNAFKQQHPNASVVLNGKIFELIIYTLLYREGVKPFYTQAKVAFVPNVEFDTILYNKSTPVSLSLKTSLRERYKQADLEAIALKYVHRKAKSYLLTLSTDEANSVKQKIESGAVIGLDFVVDCNTDEVNQMITNLKQMAFVESEKIDVVQGFVVR